MYRRRTSARAPAGSIRVLGVLEYLVVLSPRATTGEEQPVRQMQSTNCLTQDSLSRSSIKCWPTKRHAVINGLILMLACRVTADAFTALHSFAINTTNSSGVFINGDGAHPFAGLVLLGNTLYGTAQDGGSSGNGTVFAVNTDGTGFNVIYNFSGTSGTFDGNSDGAIPQGRLISAGNMLFGSAIAGGSAGVGTVFALNTDGSGFLTLHSFTGLAGNGDGAYPYGGLVLSGTTLYGTASESGSTGNGTVFALNTDGTGFRSVYSFTTCHTNASGFYTNSDGAHPWGSLMLVGSTLYGTASEGGSSGKGTIFAMNADGTGFRTLHSFGAPLEGAFPYAGLILSSNTLCGTTEFGGVAGHGTVFALNTDGSGFVTLHNFTGGDDGANPTSELTVSSNTLYGTTQSGGIMAKGTVFSVNVDGSGFTSLYSFSGSADGALPAAGLVLSGDTLYGTASAGGMSSLGTVFNLSVGSVSLPRLTILLSGANVVLLWPASATGFTLQSTSDITPPSVWTPVGTSPVIVNGQNAVTNPISQTQLFFRLIQ